MTHVTPEQAKLLKKIGFKELVYYYYNQNGALLEPFLENGSSSDCNFRVDLTDLLDNWNDGRVVSRNGNICYGCNGYLEVYSAPDQTQVNEWLRVKHNMWVRVDLINPEWWTVSIQNTLDGSFKVHPSLISHPDYLPYKTPQAAYFAAFDYILKTLLP